jgi:hypothetical protein
MNKQTIIIVEGVANSGKQEIINDLSRKKECDDFIYVSAFRATSYDEKMELLEDIEERGHSAILYDFYLNSDLNCLQREDIENKLLSMDVNVVPILSVASVEFIQEERLNETKYSNVPSYEEVKNEIDTFKSLASNSIFEWTTHDVLENNLIDNGTIKNIIEDIKK